jgi:uncharacterized protein YegP (UPF0339 family)
MTDTRGMLEEQLESYGEKLRGLNSYIKELDGMIAKHGTVRDSCEEDLMEARQNVEYYDGEIRRIRELMEKEPGSTTYQEAGGATYLVFQDSSGEWRWHLRAANNRIIADSGEGYHNREDCLHGIALVKDSKDAPVKDKS